MAICCSNLFFYSFNTIDKAFTVSGKNRFRCQVMIRRALSALKCLPKQPNCRQQRKLPKLHGSGKIQVGHGSKCIDHDPPTRCLLCYQPFQYSGIIVQYLIAAYTSSQAYGQFVQGKGRRGAGDHLPPKFCFCGAGPDMKNSRIDIIVNRRKWTRCCMNQWPK